MNSFTTYEKKTAPIKSFTDMGGMWSMDGIGFSLILQSWDTPIIVDFIKEPALRRVLEVVYAHEGVLNEAMKTDRFKECLHLDGIVCSTLSISLYIQHKYNETYSSSELMEALEKIGGNVMGVPSDYVLAFLVPTDDLTTSVVAMPVNEVDKGSTMAGAVLIRPNENFIKMAYATYGTRVDLYTRYKEEHPETLFYYNPDGTRQTLTRKALNERTADNRNVLPSIKSREQRRKEAREATKKKNKK